MAKSESDNYIFHNYDKKNEFSINLKILKGNVNIYISSDVKFAKDSTKKLVHNLKEQLFTLEIGKNDHFWSKSTEKDFTRYFKVEAEEESVYEFTIEENNATTYLSANQPKHSYIISGGKIGRASCRERVLMPV